MTRFAILLAVASLAAAPRGGAETGSPPAPRAEGQGWGLVRELRFAEALEAFRDPATPDDDWSRLGEATALLNAPPKTRSRLAEAVALLEGTARSADTEVAVASRYFLARIAQVHAYEPDWPEARRRFAALLEDHPDHPLAELGAAKLALLDLYDPTAGEPLPERFARLEALGPGLRDPAARRDFHYVMGCAAIFHGLDDRLALRHLLASRDAGLTNDVNRANVFIRIAETASALGERDLAREHYRLFLSVARRDVRTRLARERLAELDRQALEEKP